jgi:hypothetical protein
LDADLKLNLWKVDLPVDDTFEHKLSSLKLDPKQRLSPVSDMTKVFGEPNLKPKHLHIVVDAPPAGQLSTNITTFSSILIFWTTDHPP